jgi:CheY-like chemotaxis protein
VNPRARDSLTLFLTRAGMNDILPKPFTKENLLGMLEVRLLFSLNVFSPSLNFTRLHRNISSTSN